LVEEIAFEPEAEPAKDVVMSEEVPAPILQDAPHLNNNGATETTPTNEPVQQDVSNFEFVNNFQFSQIKLQEYQTLLASAYDDLMAGR
jgi:hypothetical protein